MKRIRVVHRKLGEMHGWLMQKDGKRLLVQLDGVEQSFWLDTHYVSEPDGSEGSTTEGAAHGVARQKAGRTQQPTVSRKRKRSTQAGHKRAG